MGDDEAGAAAVVELETEEETPAVLSRELPLPLPPLEWRADDAEGLEVGVDGEADNVAPAVDDDDPREEEGVLLALPWPAPLMEDDGPDVDDERPPEERDP